VLDDAKLTSWFERVLRAQFAEGRLDGETLLALLAAHRKGMEETR
jgi:hypothetical protein